MAHGRQGGPGWQQVGIALLSCAWSRNGDTGMGWRGEAGSTGAPPGWGETKAHSPRGLGRLGQVPAKASCRGEAQAGNAASALLSCPPHPNTANQGTHRRLRVSRAGCLHAGGPPVVTHSFLSTQGSGQARGAPPHFFTPGRYPGGQSTCLLLPCPLQDDGSLPSCEAGSPRAALSLVPCGVT